MSNIIKFNDIKTVEQLRARVSNGSLSVGNKMDVVRNFGTQERVNEEQIETLVTYTPQHGKTTKVWYI